jgi:bifunctional DNA-binding transcriptional regulator/antitoxin component of YhaV-PrlF toxin-antitoxin module
MTLDYQRTWEVLNELEMVTSKICSAREILESALNALENHKYNKAEALMYAADEFLQYYLAEFDEKFKVAWKETVVKLHKENEDHYNAVLREKEYYEPSMPPWGHSDLEYLANNILTKDRNSNFPEENTICDKENSSTECNLSWNSFWEENYYPEEYASSQYTDEELNAMCDAAEKQEKNKVKRWVLPVEEVENGDTGEQEYFITFPDDLLEAADLKEGDSVEYLDQGDGSYLLTKVKYTGRYRGPSWYQEALEEGYTHEELTPKEEKKLTYDEAIADGWTMTADGFWIKE